jgi:hypothetical protein
MKFWWSSETSSGVGDQSAEILKSAHQMLNEHLPSAQLDAKWEGWEWSFIAIIISPVLGVEYPERILCSKKRKDFEFRLKIDFDEFLAADRGKRISLIFQQLHRSVDLMAQYSVSLADRETLHQILNRVGAAVASVPVT